MKNTFLFLFSILVLSFTYAQEEKIKSLNKNFIIERIETNLTWQDLELDKRTLNQIKEMEIWLNDNSTLLYNKDGKMRDRIKLGNLVLFHGPPGTGKTLTATLLGKYTNKYVFRIDLSTVVSKYIGETEKNLDNVFDMDKNNESILFFDEADLLFGKNTNIRGTRDSYENKGLSYLLQRVEDHLGLVILSTTSKDNIDKAFTQRFHSIIEF